MCLGVLIGRQVGPGNTRGMRGDAIGLGPFVALQTKSDPIAPSPQERTAEPIVGMLVGVMAGDARDIALFKGETGPGSLGRRNTHGVRGCLIHAMAGDAIGPLRMPRLGVEPRERVGGPINLLCRGLNPVPGHFQGRWEPREERGSDNQPCKPRRTPRCAAVLVSYIIQVHQVPQTRSGD